MKKILVIDCCRQTKELLLELLGNDHEVLFALSARDGLSLISKDFYLVLLSLDLPGANGIDLLRRLKTKYPETPVIVTTSHGDEETCLRAFRNGALDYLKKPLNAEEVLLLIEALATVTVSTQKYADGSPLNTMREKKLFYNIQPHIAHGILRVKEHIERHYEEAINLAEACKIATMSKTNFCHYFKRITGQTFKSYLMHVRMQKAQVLISDEAMTISDIAYTLGYTDATYFSTTFRKATGSSPREHRYFCHLRNKNQSLVNKF